MMMLPCAFWPLAEHAEFGQNCFDASIGSVSVCIYYSMPIDACFFKPSFPFHRLVGSYRIRRLDKTVKVQYSLDGKVPNSFFHRCTSSGWRHFLFLLGRPLYSVL